MERRVTLSAVLKVLMSIMLWNSAATEVRMISHTRVRPMPSVCIMAQNTLDVRRD